VDILILALAFVVILLGAELFTNGIEWFGHHLELAEGAVGSILAAVGTALPETMIPVVAILFAGGSAATDVGVGAILGAPFMLSTLAMFVTGVAVLFVARRRRTTDVMAVDTRVLGLDVRYFVVGYSLAIGAAFLPVEPLWPKWLVAVGLLLLYGHYVKRHFDDDGDGGGGEDLAPLRMHRLDREAHRDDPGRPRLRVVNVQVAVALVCIIGGAVIFVGAVERLAASIGVDELLLALVIAPIATELPEKLNSIIWVRAGKHTLAMGNITGAMVFQATIPTVVGLLFASGAWSIGEGSYLAFASAGIALAATLAIFIPMARSGLLQGRSLLIGGVFYLVYLGAVIIVATGGG
jgi:cation:H+ antiporter